MQPTNQPLAKIKPYPNNAKKHPAEQIAKIAKSIKAFGFNQPIVVDKDFVIIVGHGRYFAAQKLGLEEVPVLVIDISDEKAKAYRLADNKSNESAWNEELVLGELKELSVDLIELTGFNLEDFEKSEYVGKPLSEDFIAPPISVLDSRFGVWMKRKKEWINMGIKSDDGRDEDLIFAKSAQNSKLYDLRNSMRQLNGGIDPSWDEIINEAKRQGIKLIGGTSIFDPVLCEIAYRWFCTKGGQVLDPFAGGSVRGIVAGKLGFNYLGIDLQKEQVKANEKQADEIFKTKSNNEKRPEWIVGNSLNIDKIVQEDFKADFIFSCPPYFDLEKYSEDEEDLSNLEFEEFKKQYREIIKKSVAKLKPNRFACFVVGDVRRKEKGKFCEYRNFVSETISAFLDSGMHLYNEIILLNQISQVVMRCRKQFENSRKVGKSHQNVLVFYKGDPENVAQEFEKYKFGNEKYNELINIEVAKEEEIV